MVVVPPEVGEEFQSVAVGETQVEDDEIGSVVRDDVACPCGVTGFGAEEPGPPERGDDRLTGRGVVFDDEDLLLLRIGVDVPHGSHSPPVCVRVKNRWTRPVRALCGFPASSHSHLTRNPTKPPP